MAPPKELEQFFKECVFFFEPCLNKIERIGEEMLTLGEYRVDKLSDSFIERTPD